jgi:hypothetical protein
VWRTLKAVRVLIVVLAMALLHLNPAGYELLEEELLYVLARVEL